MKKLLAYLIITILLTSMVWATRCTTLYSKLLIDNSIENIVKNSQMDKDKSLYGLSEEFYNQMAITENLLKKMTIDELLETWTRIQPAVEQAGGQHYRFLTSSVIKQISERIKTRENANKVLGKINKSLVHDLGFESQIAYVSILVKL